MAKLSRMQKYAELHSQLENDREGNSNPALNSYEEQVKDLQETFTAEALKGLNIVEDEAEEVAPANNESFFININNDESETEENKGSFFDELVARNTSNVAQNSNDLDSIISGLSSFSNNQESVNKIGFDSAGDGDYLSQTLEEVNEYNKAKGLLTAEEVPEKIVANLRNDNNVEFSTKIVEDSLGDMDDIIAMSEAAPGEISNFKQERPLIKNDLPSVDSVTMEIQNILATIEAEDEVAIEEPKIQQLNIDLDDAVNKIVTPKVFQTKLADLESADEPEEVEEEKVELEMPKITPIKVASLVPEVAEEEEEEPEFEKLETTSTMNMIRLPIDDDDEEEFDFIDNGRAVDDTMIDIVEEKKPQRPRALTKKLIEEEEDDYYDEDDTETKAFIIDSDVPMIAEDDYDDEEDAPNRLLDFVLILLILAMIVILLVVGYGLAKALGYL